MPAPKLDTWRPSECPTHGQVHAIWLDGHYGRWSAFHERVRYTCIRIDEQGKRRTHRFVVSLTGRRHTEHSLVRGGRDAEAESSRRPEARPTEPAERPVPEAPPVADASTFAIHEIAGLLIAVGTGKPLRDCAHDMRREALRRHCAPNPGRARRKLERRQGDLPEAAAELAARPIRPLEAKPDETPQAESSAAPSRTSTYNYSAPKRLRRIDASRSASVAMDYVDQYGPVVLRDVAPDRWPVYVALGSVPLPRGRSAAGTDERQDAAGPECQACGSDRGEIIVAADCELRGREYPFHARLAGGTDRESWLEFFATLAGRPTWIAAPWHQGLAEAVAEIWPETILFASEDRLRDELRAAARRDGVPEPRPEQGPLFGEIGAAFRDEDRWQALIATVRAMDPIGESATSAWLEDNGRLVREQLARKHRFRRAPFTDASVRPALDAIRGRLLPHARTMRNMWRINLRLALMCAHWSDLDHELEYVAALNRHFEATGLERAAGSSPDGRRSSVARPDWASGRDFGGARSIDDFLAAAAARRRRTHEAEHRGLMAPATSVEPALPVVSSTAGSTPNQRLSRLRTGEFGRGRRQGAASGGDPGEPAMRVFERARSWPKARRTRLDRPEDRRLRVIPDARSR